MSAKDKQEGGNHYKNMGVEVWDVVDTWPIDQQIGAHRFAALKYLMRMGSKNDSIEEIKKSIHTQEKLIEVLEAKKRQRIDKTLDRWCGVAK
jgi:hypothetical protein